MSAPEPHKEEPLPEKVTLQDFFAYLPKHEYLFGLNGSLWPAASINAILPYLPVLQPDGAPVLDKDGKPVVMKPSTWLDKYRAVHAMTWAPGEPQVILHKLADEGGWIARDGVTTFNLYKPPPPRAAGNPAGAKPWIDLLKRIYPDHVAHVTAFLAHRVQKPGEKINHGLVFTGPPGIGKDTLLEPLKHAVGPWNFKEVAPTVIVDKYTGYLRAVVLRISEARDLGEINRYAFYEKTKTMLAAPPDMLEVNTKYIPQYYIVNVVAVIFTTNYPADGLYLPQDDRRHYVCGTDVSKEEFEKEDPEFWTKFWAWYAAGGIDDVIAYLTTYDLSGFDPKKPPEKTAAFWRMADSGVAPEVPEMRDALDAVSRQLIARPAIAAAVEAAKESGAKELSPEEKKKIGLAAVKAVVDSGTFGPPAAVTLEMVLSGTIAGNDLYEWLKDRKNRRAIPHRFDACGYVPVRNKARADGLWVVGGKRQVIYAQRVLSLDEQIKAATKLTMEKAKTGPEVLQDILGGL